MTAEPCTAPWNGRSSGAACRSNCGINRKPRPRRDNMNRKATGDYAEQLACGYLQRHGLQLLTRNYRCRRGEIDIVMRDGDSLVFVEVRYRHRTAFGTAADAVKSTSSCAMATAWCLLRYDTGTTRHSERLPRQCQRASSPASSIARIATWLNTGHGTRLHVLMWYASKAVRNSAASNGCKTPFASTADDRNLCHDTGSGAPARRTPARSAVYSW